MGLFKYIFISFTILTVTVGCSRERVKRKGVKEFVHKGAKAIANKNSDVATGDRIAKAVIIDSVVTKTDTEIRKSIAIEILSKLDGKELLYSYTSGPLKKTTTSSEGTSGAQYSGVASNDKKTRTLNVSSHITLAEGEVVFYWVLQEVPSEKETAESVATKVDLSKKTRVYIFKEPTKAVAFADDESGKDDKQNSSDQETELEFQFGITIDISKADTDQEVFAIAMEEREKATKSDKK